jgi:hypothetical protein
LVWTASRGLAQSSPKHPLHQCGNKPALFRTASCNFTAEVAVLFTLYVA